MTKIRFITNQFYVDTGFDAGEVAWLPDDHAKKLVQEGNAELHYDGIPQGKEVHKADKDVAKRVRRVNKVKEQLEGN